MKVNCSMDSNMSTDEEFCDSDQINSDVEAELYSSLHHEVVSTEFGSACEKKSSASSISAEQDNVKRKESFSSDLNLSDKFCTNFDNSFKESDVKQASAFVFPDLDLKRKSNLVADILDSMQQKSDPPKKKLKTNKRNSTIRLSISSPGNRTIEIIDSDSDSSVILSEPDVTSIQTNIQLIDVSSDSDSSLSLSSGSSGAFKVNLKGINNFIKNDKDAWHINDADLHRSNRRSTGRYHENATARCSNCNEKGHVARFCEAPRVLKCFICGMVHKGSHCKQRICIKCLKFGHDSRYCSFPSDEIWCTICFMKGHAKVCCPDLWRRYHLTTSGPFIKKGYFEYHDTPIYCFNCGLEGHFGFECMEQRMDRSFPNKTCVITYDYPQESLHNIRRHVNAERGAAVYPYEFLPQFQEMQKVQREARLQRNLKRKLRKKARKAMNKDVANVKNQSKVNSYGRKGKNKKVKQLKQEVNFPRTPKEKQSENVEQMPKFKKTRRAWNKKKKAIMAAMKNSTQ